MARVENSISFFFFFTIGSFKVNDLSDVSCFLAKAFYFREKKEYQFSWTEAQNGLI